LALDWEYNVTKQITDVENAVAAGRVGHPAGTGNGGH
jgi:hypothetical protein